MNIGFYAPMKSPRHSVPSGDRAMARAVMAALTDGGCNVSLASELRSMDKDGDADIQRQLVDAAHTQIPGVIEQGRREGWKAWVTYHNYYKAPDLVGPAVSAALGIPYLLVEASRARKRLFGPWADFARRAEDGCDAANVIFYLTERDSEALVRDAPAPQSLIHLRPFLNHSTLPDASTRDGAMLSVGMMRAGDKLASYLLISETLAALPHRDWQLEIAGDGEARLQVEQMMAPFGPNVRFLGRLSAEDLAQRYAMASLMLWPGVNEAYGLAYLEAQAAGLPIVAQDRPGVRDVVQDPVAPPRKGVSPMARRVHTLLTDEKAAADAANAARRFVQDNHLRPAATRTLMQALNHALGQAA
jgi:hypothetical protein